MKILSIGNSFSQDAHKWLYDVCKSAGKEIYNANLYYGGCALYGHWNFYVNDQAVYDYEIKGEPTRKISLAKALRAEDWDIITFQQASPNCGKYETYQPFLCDLYKVVKEVCPNAKFYIHKTWAYESDCSLDCFENYDHDQHKMYNCLCDAYDKAAKDINADIIPSGDVIQYLRDNTAEFDYKNGGLSLNRDGFHLTLDYGRFAAALTWYCKIFGGKASDITLVPNWASETGLEADEKILNVIKNAVDTVVKGE